MQKLLFTCLLIFLPFTTGEECVTRRDYMNVRHALRIPYNYQSYSDSYIYGTKIQCSKIILEGNRTLETYIKEESKEQAKIAQLIYIADSNLPTIESGVFDPYNRIRKLLLGRNHIKEINSYVFNDMKNLTDLQLYNNELTEFEENTFEGCETLKILNLANNRLKSLKNINIPSLQRLHIENNSLTSINPSDFTNLKSLRTLNISCNSISYLDENLFNNLQNFSEFYASKNKLKSISPNLFKTSIENVDFSHNQIYSINCEKFNGIVDLSYNEIVTVCKFINSTQINLSNNKISYISSEPFKKLNLLRSLDLNTNNIYDINVNAFKDLYNLTYLNLSNNVINKIYIGTFHYLNDLEELDLSNNDLETFEHGIFTGLTSLENLDLSNNKIQKLDVKVFYPLSELAILSLRGNLIQNIDPNRFVSHLPELRRISLDFGNIGCEALMRIINIFNERYIRIEKGKTVKTHNINGITCDPNNFEDPFLVDNTTEKITLTQNNNNNNDHHNYDLSSIANSVSSLHTILVLTCVAFILFLVVKSIILIRPSLLCRRNSSLPTCSLKLLSENNE